ncbi:MAG: hypothetical protein LBH04_05770 [Tannerellaceae bacterium]|jgi:uncharacterized protein (DUF608 family)|nr:hypothetical protein [Tannerellaceae bacterium]
MNKKSFLHAIIFSLIFAAGAADRSVAQEEWPVLRHYDQEHLLNISLPVGGIGTGTVGIGGRGELRDIAIMNRPAIGQRTTFAARHQNQEPFFAIYVKPKGDVSTVRALIGPAHASEYNDADGVPCNHHGLPRFSSACFDAAYPLGQVSLSDDKLPVSIRLKAFNPFIPGDVPASSIPIAVLKYEVTNHSAVDAEVSICGVMRNFIGFEPGGRPKNNINTYREGESFRGIYMTTDGIAPDATGYGTVALVTTETSNVTFRRSSTDDAWSNAILNFWDDFSDDGRLTDMEKLVDDNPMASLAAMKTIAAGETSTFTFYITWHFPNRIAWAKDNAVVGNHYTTVYANAWDVLDKEVPRMGELEKRTLNFVNAFVQSSFPDEVKEAALFTLAHLRSQNVFRIASGHLMGWEGIDKVSGKGYGSCTHVWNYETATSFLFGELSRTMRDVEFNYSLDSAGLMSFRAKLPLAFASEWKAAAADGQMGTVMRLYRDYLLSGDRAFLSAYWTRVKLALSFAWVKGGWDADQDGVMEGCQHNTMDVEYYGPNPQMQFWYLGALRAGEEMAKVMKDKDFEARCRRLFENGSRWTDENMFNGEYYIQKIMPAKSREDIYPGLIVGMGAKDVTNPLYQLGEGCLVDQLVGQYMAHVLGLGYLAKPDNIRKTYQTIMKYNYVPDFTGVFNNMRSYVMGDESGLIMGSWPKGRLEIPFPYFSEVMTGYEYVAAIGMLYVGERENGLKCIGSIRSRFDGLKRNPFDDPEYGHFYSRAMASWSSVLAVSGFHYSGAERSMEFTAVPGSYFWSNGYAWGSCRVAENDVHLQVLGGSLALERFRLSDGRVSKFKTAVINEGETRIIKMK